MTQSLSGKLWIILGFWAGFGWIFRRVIIGGFFWWFGMNIVGSYIGVMRCMSDSEILLLWVCEILSWIKNYVINLIPYPWKYRISRMVVWIYFANYACIGCMCDYGPPKNHVWMYKGMIISKKCHLKRNKFKGHLIDFDLF